MALQLNLWKVDGDSLTELNRVKLESENRLETWLAGDISLLGLEVLVIGRQVQTSYGGRIDLLAIDRHADLYIIELKRDRTPRDVIAQILDYASWVKSLEYDEIDSICKGYLKKGLAEAFNDYFDEPLPENVNAAHSLVIVASEFDDSSERIVKYLAEQYEVSINVVFFSFFRQGNEEFVGRAWLRDPEQTEMRSRIRPPWSGYWFVNVGEGPYRNWDDNQRYGFLGAGHGPRYSRPLKRLHVGDKVFAYMKGQGYVGYGIVTHEACMIKDFNVDEKHTLLEVSLKATKASDSADDPDFSEWVVGINWIKIFPRDKAKTFKGAFANQNIVCELRQPQTVEFLEKEFGTTSD
jgi:hypothetical protein